MNCKNYNIDKYLYIYAYCLLGKGQRRFSIYNSIMDKIHLFDVSYYKFVKLFRKKKLSSIYFQYRDERSDIDYLIRFLLDNELARIVDDINLFPEIKTEWDFPYNVKRALIDIQNTFHDMKDIFAQLTALSCHTVEIRFFRAISASDLLRVTNGLTHEIIQSIIFILPYQEDYLNGNFYSVMNKMVEEDHRFSFFLYNTPAHLIQTSQDLINKEYLSLSLAILFSEKKIVDCTNCGVIDYQNFFAVSIEKYMENKLFNSCLNRQISIDVNGSIKNCPSMNKIWGNIAETSLQQIYDSADFRKLWTITKDKIKICNKCELRYLCPDCRAFTITPNDIFSKPKKCNYDPTKLL